MVPVPPKIAPLLIVTPLVFCKLPLTSSVPLRMSVGPLYELSPPSVRAPPPAFVSPAGPPIGPEKTVVPASLTVSV